MSRIKRADVDGKADRVSGMLRDGISVSVQGRNGYYGLDRYDRHGMVDTLAIGTLREIDTYLNGMVAALAIVGRD